MLSDYHPRFAGSTEHNYAPPQSRDASIPPVAWEGKASGDANRTFTFTISSATTDRMGDRLPSKDGSSTIIRRTRSCLWGHDGSMFPVGKATRIWIQGGKLKATAELAPASVCSVCRACPAMIAAGYLGATSVGFAPIRMKLSSDKARPYRDRLHGAGVAGVQDRQIPANPDCLLDPGQLSTKAAQVRRARDVRLEHDPDLG